MSAPPAAPSNESEILRMRTASGTVKSEDPLVSFVYLLARDRLPVGALETFIDQATFDGEVVFTNGWLATWAMDAAKRLRPAGRPMDNGPVADAASAQPQRSAGWEAAAEIVSAARPFARCQRLSYVERLHSDKPCGDCNGCRLAGAVGVPS